MGLIKGTVKLENNYEKFVKEYEDEKEKLLKIFKGNNIIVEHIGSTSVKGLKAKPIIDIAIGVSKFKDFEYYKKLFDKKEYEVRNSLEMDEILIVKGNENYTSVLIHLMELNGSRYQESILFRDYLKSNKNALEEYQTLKEKLAEKYSNDRVMYTKSKNDFIKENITKALKENDAFEKFELKEITNEDYIDYYNNIKQNMKNSQWLGDFDVEKLEEVLKSGGKLFNYFNENELVCSVMYMESSQKTVDKFKLNYDYTLVAGCGPIMVSPKYIGSGYQNKMLLKLEKYCNSLGKKYLLTTVYPENEYSIKNFLKNEYKFIKQVEFKRGKRNLYVKELKCCQ